MSHRGFEILGAMVILAGLAAGQPKAAPKKGPGNAPGQPVATFQIEGDVLDAAGTGIFGVLVSTAVNRSANTDHKGHFALKGIPRQGTYVVKASKAQYTFEPAQNMVSSPKDGNVAGVRFTGTKSGGK